MRLWNNSTVYSFLLQCWIEKVGKVRRQNKTGKVASCNVILGRVRGTTVFMENKYHVFWVCVCILSYPAYAVYHIVICVLSGCTFFSHYIIWVTIFRRKSYVTQNVCFEFLKQVDWNFVILRSIQRDNTINVRRSSCTVSVIIAII
jgi:hypothetical protein